MPVLRAERADAGPDIGNDFTDRRIFTGDGGPADPRFRIGGDDGEGRGDAVGRFLQVRFATTAQPDSKSREAEDQQSRKKRGKTRHGKIPLGWE
jgi:hypothetical protein